MEQLWMWMTKRPGFRAPRAAAPLGGTHAWIASAVSGARVEERFDIPTFIRRGIRIRELEHRVAGTVFMENNVPAKARIGMQHRSGAGEGNRTLV